MFHCRNDIQMILEGYVLFYMQQQQKHDYLSYYNMQELLLARKLRHRTQP